MLFKSNLKQRIRHVFGEKKTAVLTLLDSFSFANFKGRTKNKYNWNPVCAFFIFSCFVITIFYPKKYCNQQQHVWKQTLFYFFFSPFLFFFSIFSRTTEIPFFFPESLFCCFEKKKNQSPFCFYPFLLFSFFLSPL